MKLKFFEIVMVNTGRLWMTMVKTERAVYRAYERTAYMYAKAKGLVL